MVDNFNLPQDVMNKLIMLSAKEVVEGVIYALSRSPNAEVSISMEYACKHIEIHRH